jgi:hypothetical protein
MPTAIAAAASHVMLFNHGVESAGLADIARWRAMSRSGDRPGRLLDVSAITGLAAG